MFMNPMDSLPGYGEIIKRKCNLDTSSDDRCGGDMVAAVVDYMIGRAWKALGLFPEEEEMHRKGVSIIENQTFLDWVMSHLIKDMNWNEEDIESLMIRGIEAFNKRQDEKEEQEGEC